MIITMRYELPMERDEMILAQQGADYFCILADILQECREVTKCKKEYESADLFAEHLRDVIHDRMEDLAKVS